MRFDGDRDERWLDRRLSESIIKTAIARRPTGWGHTWGWWRTLYQPVPQMPQLDRDDR